MRLRSAAGCTRSRSLRSPAGRRASAPSIRPTRRGLGRPPSRRGHPSSPGSAPWRARRADESLPAAAAGARTARGRRAEPVRAARGAAACTTCSLAACSAGCVAATSTSSGGARRARAPQPPRRGARGRRASMGPWAVATRGRGSSPPYRTNERGRRCRRAASLDWAPDGCAMTASGGTFVPFNRPEVVGTEHAYIAEAIARGQLSAGGLFTERCCNWLESATGCRKALLVHSATAALELAALLLDVGPGDEVVMPSFTFVSSANAVALRGGTPVFVDVRPDTLNLDETLVEG